MGGRDSGEGEGDGRESERKRELESWNVEVCEMLICRDGIWAI